MTAPNFLQESIAFDGKDDYIELPEMQFDFSGGITIEAWTYYESLPSEAVIISLGNPDNTPPTDITLQCTAPHGISMSTQGTGSSSLHKIEELEKWIHTAVTIAPSRSCQIYQDGSQIVGRFVDLPIKSKRSLNCIGKNYKYNEDFFHGRLGEIRLWNIARSQAEIANNMNRPLTGNESGLIGYWPLNEGSGTIAHDLSQNANHGKIQGATWQEKSEPGQEATPSKVVMATGLEDYSYWYNWKQSLPPHSSSSKSFRRGRIWT